MKELLIIGRTGISRIVSGRYDTFLKEIGAGRRIAAIIDPNVARLYPVIPKKIECVTAGRGERNKTLGGAAKLAAELLKMGIDRSALLLGIGGGITTDMAGFVASTYMRGVGFAFVPTTLLAQVDAAIGGKNGVNLEGYKNIIGVIRQPEAVIIDRAFLKTLPAKELRYGFAESIKHGLVADRRLFELLESRAEEIAALDEGPLEQALNASVKVKVGVVSEDEEEHGRRMILNFGHTFGHAFEKLLGIPHGEAIAVGMVKAARLSERVGMIGGDQVGRIVSTLKKYRLPVEIPGLDPETVLSVMKKDKKRRHGKLKLVLLGSIGEAKVCDLPDREIKAAI